MPPHSLLHRLSSRFLQTTDALGELTDRLQALSSTVGDHVYPPHGRRHSHDTEADYSTLDETNMSRGGARTDPIEIPDDDFLSNDGVPLAFPPTNGLVPNPSKTKASVGDDIGPNPSYYDQKFKILMYRGPGYEEFPVALISDIDFLVVANEWEEKRTLLQRRRSKIISSGPSNRLRQPQTFHDAAEFLDDSPISTPPNGNNVLDDNEEACLAQVLQIFPTIDHHFVRQRWDSWHSSHSDTSQGASDPAADIIAEILDEPTYPQHKVNKRKRSPSMSEKEAGKINWGRGEPLGYGARFSNALGLLAEEFCHIPTNIINKKLFETGKLFDTYQFLEDCERDYHSKRIRPYRRLRTPRVTLEAKYVPKEPDLNRPPLEYAYLVNEFQAAKKACRDKLHQRKRQKEDEDAEAENLAIHIASGNLIECQCCFDDEIPMNRAVPCDGEKVHFYCYGCVKNQAASQIGQMKYEINCMFSGAESCTASLQQTLIREVLDSRTLAKLEELQRNADILLAEIEGLEECPFCEYKAICLPVEVDREFACRAPECSKTSCRLCHDLTHIPKTCEEARKERDKERGTTLRHGVEEAMSNALMRRCPNAKCKMPIVKDYGCNKVVCQNCRTIMCYVCGKDITKGRGSGYEHFRTEGQGCDLRDDALQGVDQQQVAKAKAEAIKKLREENPDIDEAALEVPDGPERTQAQAQAAAALPRYARFPVMPDRLQQLLNQHQERLPHLAGRVAGRAVDRGAAVAEMVEARLAVRQARDARVEQIQADIDAARRNHRHGIGGLERLQANFAGLIQENHRVVTEARNHHAEAMARVNELMDLQHPPPPPPRVGLPRIGLPRIDHNNADLGARADFDRQVAANDMLAERRLRQRTERAGIREAINLEAMPLGFNVGAPNMDGIAARQDVPRVQFPPAALPPLPPPFAIGDQYGLVGEGWPRYPDRPQPAQGAEFGDFDLGGFEQPLGDPWLNMPPDIDLNNAPFLDGLGDEDFDPFFGVDMPFPARPGWMAQE